LTVLLAVHSGFTLSKYGSRNEETRVFLSKLEQRMEKVKQEQSRLTSLIEKEAKTRQPKIDLINSVILKKSFSWSDFLSDLEELLPDSCYILSLAPVPGEDQKIEVSMSVATPTLNELLVFIDRLIKRNYSGVRTRGETRTENGYLLVRISFAYERTF
jgi:Tfp pilus assembly protein PilN